MIQFSVRFLLLSCFVGLAAACFASTGPRQRKLETSFVDDLDDSGSSKAQNVEATSSELKASNNKPSDTQPLNVVHIPSDKLSELSSQSASKQFSYRPEAATAIDPQNAVPIASVKLSEANQQSIYQSEAAAVVQPPVQSEIQHNEFFQPFDPQNQGQAPIQAPYREISVHPFEKVVGEGPPKYILPIVHHNPPPLPQPNPFDQQPLPQPASAPFQGQSEPQPGPGLFQGQAVPQRPSFQAPHPPPRLLEIEIEPPIDYNLKLDYDNIEAEQPTYPQFEEVGTLGHKAGGISFGGPPNTPKTIAAATLLLQSMDVYDISNIRVDTFAKMPPEALDTVNDIKSRLPESALRKVGGYSVGEMERAIGELLNQLPTSRLQSMGPVWMDLVPALPEGAWRVLTPRVILSIPYEQYVANVDTSVWRELSPEAYRKLPCSFYGSAPLSILLAISPAVWARLGALPYQCISYRNIAKLPWVEIAKFEPDSAIFNGMDPSKISLLPWPEMFYNLRPSTFLQLQESVLNFIAPHAWRAVTPAQLRAIRPGHLTKLPMGSLRNISPAKFRALGYDYLKAFDPETLRIATAGAIII